MRKKWILLILIFYFIIACKTVTDSDPEPLNYNQLKNISWKLHTPASSGLHHKSVFKILIDRFGNKWLGTYEQGLAKWDVDGNWHVFSTANSGLPDDKVYSLAMDSNDNLWVGTRNGLAKFDGNDWTVFTQDNTAFPLEIIRSVAVDKTNRVWFCCGNIWVAVSPEVLASGETFSHELAMFNGEEWFIVSEIDPTFINTYFPNMVVDDDNVLWLAAPDFGIFEIHPTPGGGALL